MGVSQKKKKKKKKKLLTASRNNDGRSWCGACRALLLLSVRGSRRACWISVFVARGASMRVLAVSMHACAGCRCVRVARVRAASAAEAPAPRRRAARRRRRDARRIIAFERIEFGAARQPSNRRSPESPARRCGCRARPRRGSVPPSQQRTITPTREAVARADRIHDVRDRLAGDHRIVAGGAEVRALGAELDDHAARAPLQIKAGDVLGLRVAGQSVALADARQRGRRARRARSGLRPSRRATARASGAGWIERDGLAGSRASRADEKRVRASSPRSPGRRRSDADDAPATRSPPRSRRPTGGSPPSRSEVFDGGVAAVVVLRLQLEARRIALVGGHAALVDAFSRQRVAHILAE